MCTFQRRSSTQSRRGACHPILSYLRLSEWLSTNAMAKSRGELRARAGSRTASTLPLTASAPQTLRSQALRCIDARAPVSNIRTAVLCRLGAIIADSQPRRVERVSAAVIVRPGGAAKVTAQKEELLEGAEETPLL